MKLKQFINETYGDVIESGKKAVIIDDYSDIVSFVDELASNFWEEYGDSKEEIDEDTRDEWISNEIDQIMSEYDIDVLIINNYEIDDGSDFVDFLNRNGYMHKFEI